VHCCGQQDVVLYQHAAMTEVQSVEPSAACVVSPVAPAEDVAVDLFHQLLSGRANTQFIIS